MTSLEAAAVLGITDRAVLYQIAKGQLRGARRLGSMWVVPADAVVARLLTQLRRRAR